MEPVSTTLTLIEFISLLTVAVKSGSKAAISIMQMIEDWKAGKVPTREELTGALQKIDADAVLTNSLINNPISLSGNSQPS